MLALTIARRSERAPPPRCAHERRLEGVWPFKMLIPALVALSVFDA